MEPTKKKKKLWPSEGNQTYRSKWRDISRHSLLFYWSTFQNMQGFLTPIRADCSPCIFSLSAYADFQLHFGAQESVQRTICIFQIHHILESCHCEFKTLGVFLFPFIKTSNGFPGWGSHRFDVHPTERTPRSWLWTVSHLLDGRKSPAKERRWIQQQNQETCG